MMATIGILVQLSQYPISIIIVGVGNADFQMMEELDSDGGPLRDAYGNFASRDIVQFVKFSDYQNDSARLAAEVLREVPDQFLGYMENKGISIANFQPSLVL
jgi:hypothetical protein